MAVLCKFTDEEVAEMIEEIKMLRAEGWGVPALDKLLERLTHGATAD